MFTMMCSFTADTDGYEYELAHSAEASRRPRSSRTVGPGPWRMPRSGPTPPAADGTRRRRIVPGSRVRRRLPDDPHLHAALIAFATDITGTGGRPLHLEGDSPAW